tara:strand:+ start:152 stop:547 length:396 start_codon:yes stop_codon:yes gene_type:complete
MTFIKESRELAEQKSIEITHKKQEIKNDKENKKDKILDELFINLTKIYYDKLKDSITRRSIDGKRELYFNFVYNDFKANCNGLGNPPYIQNLWLEEMCNKDSKYLPYPNESFEGLIWKIWKNRSFTTVFTW